MTTIAERAGAAHRMTRKPSRLATLKPRLSTADLRAVKPEPKRADAELLTPEHKAWRAAVLRRAGYRCEWVENGQRCERAAPEHRMIADHIVERADGGAWTDPANGQCLCTQHNTLKGVRARAARMARP